MKILALDCGNTRLKWGWWESAGGDDRGDWTRVGSLALSELGDRRTGIAGVVAELPRPDRIAGANVAGDGVRALLDEAMTCWSVDTLWARSMPRQCGVINGYSRPETLGVDRWAALIGARHRHRGAALVVGAGTATTIDMLSARGEFRGGVILPGLDLMKQSLAEHTARLPMAEGRYADEPRCTDDAIESGVLHAQAGAIERMAALAGEGAVCLLSGGAAAKIAVHMRRPIQRIDHLVLEGLVRIALEAS